VRDTIVPVRQNCLQSAVADRRFVAISTLTFPAIPRRLPQIATISPSQMSAL
jgi:hypothetical protein